MFPFRSERLDSLGNISHIDEHEWVDLRQGQKEIRVERAHKIKKYLPRQELESLCQRLQIPSCVSRWLLVNQDWHIQTDHSLSAIESMKLEIIHILYSFWFYPLHRCVLALYTRYFPKLCEQKSQAYYSGGFRTHDLFNSREVYRHFILDNAPYSTSFGGLVIGV